MKALIDKLLMKTYRVIVRKAGKLSTLKLKALSVTGAKEEAFEYIYSPCNDKHAPTPAVQLVSIEEVIE